MEYIYAAMLLHKAGKDITDHAVKAVLSAAGVSVEETRVKALVAALQGVDIEAAIQKAAVAAPVAMASAPSGAGNGGAKADEKKEEKASKEDQKKAEEQAAAGLGSLFG